MNRETFEVKPEELHTASTRQLLYDPRDVQELDLSQSIEQIRDKALIRLTEL